MSILCLLETWYAADSVTIRRFRMEEFEVVERARPRSRRRLRRRSTSTTADGVRLVVIEADFRV